MTNKENNLPPLHQAAMIRRVDEVKQLLDDGADVKERDDDGNTALHWAARSFKVPAARVLIDEGVDVFACNNDKKIALNLAIEYNGYANDLVRCLCEEMIKKGGKYLKQYEEELSELGYRRDITNSPD